MKLQEILLALAEPVPQEFISKREQKDKKTGKTNKILYTAWPDLIALLQQRAGIDGFSWQILDTKQVGERFVMTGRLTIHGEDGTRSMDATGQEVLNCSSYGDPSSNAEAMALRRACAKFGLGLALWDKEEKAALLEAMTQPAPPPPVDTSDWRRWKSPDDGIRWASKELDLPQSRVKALWEEEKQPKMMNGEWSKIVAQIKNAKAAINGEAPATAQAIAEAIGGEVVATVPATAENPFG